MDQLNAQLSFCEVRLGVKEENLLNRVGLNQAYFTARAGVDCWKYYAGNSLDAYAFLIPNGPAPEEVEISIAKRIPSHPHPEQPMSSITDIIAPDIYSP